jgi:hypothetical protein
MSPIADRAQQEKQRRDDRNLREHRDDEDAGDERLLPAHSQARQRVGTGRTEQNRERRRGAGDYQ